VEIFDPSGSKCEQPCRVQSILKRPPNHPAKTSLCCSTLMWDRATRQVREARLKPLTREGLHSPLASPLDSTHTRCSPPNPWLASSVSAMIPSFRRTGYLMFRPIISPNASAVSSVVSLFNAWRRSMASAGGNALVVATGEDTDVGIQSVLITLTSTRVPSFRKASESVRLMRSKT
jgi:hypothetical protein